MSNSLKLLLRPIWHFLKALGRKTNQLLLKPIRALPISSEQFGPPKTYYRSTPDWLKATQEPGADYQAIYSETVLKREPPQTLDEEVNWKIQLEYQRPIPKVFVATIPQGRLWVNRGSTVNNSAIITGDDRILADLSLEFGKRPQDNLIFEQWKLPPVHFLPGQAVALTMAKGEIYFHWILDLLPKFKILQLAGIDFDEIDHFIVNSHRARFQKETLAHLGIPAHKVVESTVHSHIKAESLIVPSLPTLSGNPTQWTCDFLREAFLPNSSSDDFQSNVPAIARLYVHRRTARYRKVLNEAQVWELLAGSFGFETATSETLTVVEQAVLFNRAKVIVAPHGAGLTNLVFCAPGTTVIEIFSPNYVNACYYALSQQLGLNYYYLIGEGQPPPAGVDPHLAGDDILIDVAKLRQLLDLAGGVSLN
ncbi:MAG: glycosyltransferase family 61 protein [Spirulinaceae cyanobacterium]